MVQVDLLENVMILLALGVEGAGLKFSKDNTTSRLQVLKICSSSQPHQSVMSVTQAVKFLESLVHLI